MFMLRFPINSIPYSTESEKKIKSLEKEIIKIRIKILKLKQRQHETKADIFQREMALLNMGLNVKSMMLKQV